MISGLFIVTLMLSFAGLFYWAWSSRRRDDFASAADIPLRDEATPACCARKETGR